MHVSSRDSFCLALATLIALLAHSRVSAQPHAVDAGFPQSSEAAPHADPGWDGSAPSAGEPEARLDEDDAGVEAPSGNAEPILLLDASVSLVPPLAVDPALLQDDSYGAQALIERAPGPGEFAFAGTGSRVNAPLEELPVTVDTVSQETLRERGIADLSQALTLLPGIVPNWQYGGFLYVQSRGFEAVTLYDGRRDARSVMAESAPQVGLFDLDRIEVVRGPTSVLYGYGAVGGAVNLIRRRASDKPGYELELGLGTPKQVRAHVGAQGAIREDLSYRVDLGHATYRNFRGYESARSQVTTTLRYAPSTRHTLNLRASYAFDRYNTDVGIPTVEDPARPGRWTLPYGARRDARYGSRNDFLDYQRLEAAADYRFDLTRRIYFEARGAVTRDAYRYLAAESLKYVPLVGDARAQVEREYLYFARRWRPVFGSAELHARLRTGPIAHQLVLGYSIDSFTGVTDRSGLDGATPAPVDFAYPVDNEPRVGFARTAADHYRVATHSVYGFDHIKLTEALILTGGVRLDVLRSRTRRQHLSREAGAPVVDPATSELRKANLSEDLATTGQVGLVYEIAAPVITYASYGTAFKPHFVSPSARAVTAYTPESSQQLEGGLRLRGEARGHRLDLDAAGYLIRKRNILVPRGLDDFATAGLAQSRGVDLTVRYSAPAYVSVDGGYALVDAHYEKFVGPDAVTGESRDFSGNVLQLAPRHSGNAWLHARIAENLRGSLGTRVMGRQWADDQNRLRLPRYALLDASLSYGFGHATFVLSANNLLGRTDYFTAVINSGSAQPQVTPGAGRELFGMLRLAL